jgi:hypothetical protein
MASKKTIKKTGSHEVPKVKILIELSRRAEREVKTLLKRSEAGTITNAELNTGLKEVAAPLKQMLDYIEATLEDVSKLQKRTELKTITTKQLSTDLHEIDRSVNLMLDHGDFPHH